MDKRIILISCMAVSILITGCIQSQEEEPSGPEACSQVYKPVCGKNGQTYSNDCVARQKGVEVDYPGECRKEPETTIREKCGDGVCDETERKRNLCPEDCENPPHLKNKPAQSKKELSALQMKHALVLGLMLLI